MKSLKGLIGLLVVVGLAFLAVRQMLSKPTPQTGSTPQTPTTATDTSDQPMMAGWQMAQNGAVRVEYPASFTTYQAMEPYFFLAQDLVSIYTNDATYKAANYSQDGRLIISKAAGDETTCFTAPEIAGNKPFGGDILLSGTAWRSVSFSDAGAGNRYETTVYRTYAAGNCYEIATTLHYASDFTGLDLKAVASSQLSMTSLLQAVVATVRLKP